MLWWQYLIFAILTLIVAPLSAIMGAVCNPVTALFMVAVSPAILCFNRMPPKSWGAMGPSINIGALWPLTLAPLYYLNFQVLERGNWSYFGLFCATGWLISFVICLRGSSPMDTSKQSIRRIASQYRKLRKEFRKRQVDHTSSQADRDWHHRASSNFYGLMCELERRINAAHFTESKILRLMGSPDATLSEDELHGDDRVPAGEKRLVYHCYSDTHHVYMVVRDGKVVESKWFNK